MHPCARSGCRRWQEAINSRGRPSSAPSRSTARRCRSCSNAWRARSSQGPAKAGHYVPSTDHDVLKADAAYRSRGTDHDAAYLLHVASGFSRTGECMKRAAAAMFAGVLVAVVTFATSAAQSPNAFGVPSTEQPQPGAAIKAVPGSRAQGWLAQGRSEVLARHGIVATSDPLAAEAGLEM